MPGRKEPLTTGCYYHVFNKAITGNTPLSQKRNLVLLKKILFYYRSYLSQPSYSKFTKLPPATKKQILKQVSNKQTFLVDILAYCFMPNHFHLLLKQNVDNGISRFMSLSINAFTKHTNLRTNRHGPLFLPRFKAVHIRTEEQLMHLSRYIHLNPHASKTTMKLSELKGYPWSSLREYLSPDDTEEKLSQPDVILSMFGNNLLEYESFVADRADYQRSLESLKHLRNPRG